MWNILDQVHAIEIRDGFLLEVKVCKTKETPKCHLRQPVVQAPERGSSMGTRVHTAEQFKERTARVLSLFLICRTASWRSFPPRTNAQAKKASSFRGLVGQGACLAHTQTVHASRGEQASDRSKLLARSRDVDVKDQT